jgi:hypothetical protein
LENERKKLFKWWAVVESCQKELTAWSTLIPDNFEHLVSIVGAESARWQSNGTLRAMKLYKKAMTLAKHGGWLYHEALIYDRYADFFMVNDDSITAGRW